MSSNHQLNLQSSSSQMQSSSGLPLKNNIAEFDAMTTAIALYEALITTQPSTDTASCTACSWRMCRIMNGQRDNSEDIPINLTHRRRSLSTEPVEAVLSIMADENKSGCDECNPHSD